MGLGTQDRQREDDDSSQRAAKHHLRKDNKANPGFEQTLWLATSKHLNNTDAVAHKHVVLRLIFLKYCPDTFA